MPQGKIDDKENRAGDRGDFYVGVAWGIVFSIPLWSAVIAFWEWIKG